MRIPRGLGLVALYIGALLVALALALPFRSAGLAASSNPNNASGPLFIIGIIVGAPIAILFIAFDLEIAFVFPWAVIFRQLGVIGLVEMGIFLGLLVLGFVYVWKKGALECE